MWQRAIRFFFMGCGAALCLGVTAASPISAVVPSFISQQIPEAKAGAATRFRWFAFSVYDARLYVAPGFIARNFSAQPFALELTYLRDLKGVAIAERSDEEITKLGYGTPAQRAQWLEKMRALFPNVSDGKRLTGLHVPQQGAVFFVDDKPLGEIRDPEFSKAFFAIWLDERTSAPELRAGLLAQAR